MQSDSCSQNRIWQDIKINGEMYMISATKWKNTWKIILTNLVKIWTNILTTEAVLRKCQILNPLLDLDAVNVNDIISKILENVAKYISYASVNEIKLSICIHGGIFKFDFSLTEGTAEQFWKEITQPLCLSSFELLRRHKILVDLVKRKDEEIAEYKAQGAELIRKYLATEPYKEMFNEDPSVFKSMNYTSVFQEIISFYDTLNCKNIQREDTENSTQQIEDTDNISKNEEQEPTVASTSQSANCTLQTSSKLSENNVSFNSHKITNNRESQKKVSPKIKSAPEIIPKATKRTKQTLNDFIL